MQLPCLRRVNLLFTQLGLDAQRPISADPMLNFSLGFFSHIFKSLFEIIFCILFRASNNYILDNKNSTEFSYKLSNLKSDFTPTLGYLKPSFEQPGPGLHKLNRISDCCVTKCSDHFSPHSFFCCCFYLKLEHALYNYHSPLPAVKGVHPCQDYF